ncbi:C-C motif chemokine 7-like isoform X3 [Micropterus salmoides]|uniref:C-C motif chemokine 7-like isoform X2 n=1 Tax=Micropterus salmoides TaxID=27706 RepID=UPI0018ED0A11|nr:C-C motif chemokine 7-like isoform X2 [Micropterus salmoides]XP_038557952.1 C-C motif chemokine 7-like isoform X3 [Micropterus salmoides]
MRTLVTILLLTLVCFLSYSSAAPLAPGISNRNGCCLKSTQMHIPKGKITDVAMTPSDCEQQAIVVSTVCNKKFCIDPNWIWAKNLLKEFEKSTANNSPPSAPFNVTRCTEKV